MAERAIEPPFTSDGPCGEDGGCATMPGCRCPFTIEPPFNSPLPDRGGSRERVIAPATPLHVELGDDAVRDLLAAAASSHHLAAGSPPGPRRELRPPTPSPSVGGDGRGVRADSHGPLRPDRERGAT